MEKECDGDQQAAKLVMDVMRQLWEWYKQDASGLKAVIDLADEKHLPPLHKVRYAVHRERM
jgi:hypothetical protein